MYLYKKILQWASLAVFLLHQRLLFWLLLNTTTSTIFIVVVILSCYRFYYCLYCQRRFRKGALWLRHLFGLERWRTGKDVQRVFGSLRHCSSLTRHYQLCSRTRIVKSKFCVLNAFSNGNFRSCFWQPHVNVWWCVITILHAKYFCKACMFTTSFQQIQVGPNTLHNKLLSGCKNN